MARGRPRTFDRDIALRRAMETFWRCGYESTSLDELTAAMGISKPSLYAAFGNKEDLFREALGLFERAHGEPATRGLGTESTAKAAVESVLRGNVEEFVDTATPPGCMITLTGLLGAPAHGEIHELLEAKRRGAQDQLAARLDQGVRDGELDPSVDTRALAGFYQSVLNGLSIQSRDGASRENMDAVVDQAMAAWEVLARPAVVAG